jgi:hypothetical protein
MQRLYMRMQRLYMRMQRLYMCIQRLRLCAEAGFKAGIDPPGSDTPVGLVAAGFTSESF